MLIESDQESNIDANHDADGKLSSHLQSRSTSTTPKEGPSNAGDGVEKRTTEFLDVLVAAVMAAIAANTHEMLYAAVTSTLMLPPPVGGTTYASKEALILGIREFGRGQGYTVVIQYTQKDGRKVVLTFDMRWVRTYPTYILIDCTYKTNRFKLPFKLYVQDKSFFTLSDFYFPNFFHWFLFHDERRQRGLQVGCACSRRICLQRIRIAEGGFKGQSKSQKNALAAIMPTTARLLCRWNIFKNPAANLKEVVEDGKNWTKLEGYFWAVVTVDTEIAFEVK
ncbi:hypothetical protein PsorP6_011162 [Peronosclerospora sorghi]|uniref:Uncharacterized protein n=1 Tax=Peronosclerospora sorghi TaxID=230839 RepID=A0ACC0VYZ0_9STRA|nr:hypothetical protein PsorP6_011162 [Peronosclerospora sorghi]